MSGFTSDNIDQIVTACRENVSAIAESLNLNLGRQDRIEIGETTTWSPETVPADLEGPGLAVMLTVAEQSMLCLIPASLPLPEWYTHPGMSEAAQLQTLAMEWSLNLLPADFEAESFQSVAVESLRQVIEESDSSDQATVLELRVLSSEDADSSETNSDADDDAETPPATEETPDAGDEQTPDAEGDQAEQASGEQAEESGDEQSEDDAPSEEAEQTAGDAGDEQAEEASGEQAEETGDEQAEDDAPAENDAPAEESEQTAGDAGPRLFLIWPITNPALPTPQPAEPSAEAESPQDQAESDSPTAPPVNAPQPVVPIGQGLSDQARRVLSLPVTVVVRLAQKKIELSQLLSLTPGSLLMFNKPCEDLLDLYVNNQRYCQGEAVKIGEKFGLKITQVGVVDKRAPRVLQN